MLSHLKKYWVSAGAKILVFSFMKVSSCQSFTFFRALSVGKATKKGILGVAQRGSVAEKMPRPGEKNNYWHMIFNACASKFCEPNFQKFRLKWWRKELPLHCGDELIGLGSSWMGLTYGNIIFDTLKPPAFQKHSICWVFQTFFCSIFFYMLYATLPSPSQQHWIAHDKH